MKKLVLAAVALCIATTAEAHEIWVERDDAGPARIYLGEPAEALPPGGDPEFEKLKAPHVLSAPSAALTRRAGYIEVTVPAGDVRVWDDAVFTPWGDAGKKESVAYYARAGRQDTKAVLPFEIVPAAADGDRFLLIRDGKPVPSTAVTVISPDKWTKSLTTDATGAITVPSRGAGRYLLTASIKDEGAHTTPAGPVVVLHRITTTSFVAR